MFLPVSMAANLLVRMEELESGAELLVSEDALLALSETRGELESRTHQLDECKQKESGLEASIEQLQQSIRSLQTQVDTVKVSSNRLWRDFGTRIPKFHCVARRQRTQTECCERATGDGTSAEQTVDPTRKEG